MVKHNCLSKRFIAVFVEMISLFKTSFVLSVFVPEQCHAPTIKSSGSVTRNNRRTWQRLCVQKCRQINGISVQIGVWLSPYFKSDWHQSTPPEVTGCVHSFFFTKNKNNSKTSGHCREGDWDFEKINL